MFVTPVFVSSVAKTFIASGSMGFGYSRTWTQPLVYITDQSTQYLLQWDEVFPPNPLTDPNIPNYGWYPWSMTPPLDISHNNYETWRDALFYNTNPSSNFGIGWWLHTYVRYDDNFHYIIPLVLGGGTTHVRDIYWTDYYYYPATGYA